MKLTEKIYKKGAGRTIKKFAWFPQLMSIEEFRTNYKQTYVWLEFFWEEQECVESTCHDHDNYGEAFLHTEWKTKKRYQT